MRKPLNDDAYVLNFLNDINERDEVDFYVEHLIETHVDVVQEGTEIREKRE